MHVSLSGKLNEKMIISLTGFMGCGKSSTGRELAARPGVRLVDLDAEIVARSGRAIPEIFREGGEAAFRAVELEHRVPAAGEDHVLRAVERPGGFLEERAPGCIRDLR